MQYCDNCRVYVRGNKERCVLCGNQLSPAGRGEEEPDLFPDIPPEYESHLALRIMILFSVTTIVASFAARMIFPTTVNWPLYVLFGLLSMWLSLIIIVRKRHNIPKTIVWQVSIVSVLSIFWDWQTGGHGWAADYVIPFAFVTAILVMYITGKITRLKIRDYVFYALLSGLFGIIPVVFIIFDLAEVIYPSIISVAANIIFLSALFIFQGKNIKKELEKRLHI
ncbi:MAG: hypothetical protein EOM54_09480 [Clostridia bacterium]|nr:hypothetical protein [Clostridia bacterium]